MAEEVPRKPDEPTKRSPWFAWLAAVAVIAVLLARGASYVQEEAERRNHPTKGHPLSGAPAIALAPDGSVYTAGSGGFARWAADLTGGPAYPLGSAPVTASGLHILPDGRILVANTYGLSVAVLRLNPEGGVTDPAFWPLSGRGRPCPSRDVSSYCEAEWESQGAQPGLGRLAVDRQGNVYVTDAYNHNIHKLSPNGRELAVFGKFGKEPGQFNAPWSVAVADDGRIFVADTENSRIQALNPDGSVLGQVGSPGTGPGQIAWPGDLAIGPDGLLYVADSFNERVQVYSLDGSFVRTLIGPVDNSKLMGFTATVASVAVAPNGNVYYADTHNQLTLVSPSGSVLARVELSRANPNLDPLVVTAVSAVGLVVSLVVLMALLALTLRLRAEMIGQPEWDRRGLVNVWYVLTCTAIAPFFALVIWGNLDAPLLTPVPFILFALAQLPVASTLVSPKRARWWAVAILATFATGGFLAGVTALVYAIVFRGNNINALVMIPAAFWTASASSLLMWMVARPKRGGGLWLTSLFVAGFAFYLYIFFATRGTWNPPMATSEPIGSEWYITQSPLGPYLNLLVLHGLAAGLAYGLITGIPLARVARLTTEWRKTNAEPSATPAGLDRTSQAPAH